MPEIVNCPQCDRKLRVPDELIGQSVKCPTCAVTFTATTTSAAPPPPPPPPAPPPQEPDVLQRRYEESEPPPPPSDPWGSSSRGGQADQGRRSAFEGYGDDTSRRSALRGPALAEVSGPALALTIITIIDLAVVLLCFCMGLITAVGNAAPPAVPEARVPAVEWNNVQVRPRRQFGGPGGGVRANNADPVGGAFGCIVLILHLVAQIFVLLGAGKMKRLESFGMSLTACILCVIPCVASPLGIVGLPFGIWGLVVLNKPEVKDAFYR